MSTTLNSEPMHGGYQAGSYQAGVYHGRGGRPVVKALSAAMTVASLSGPDHADHRMECEVLAAVLRSQSAQETAMDLLDDSCFADPQNQMIWRACHRLYNSPDATGMGRRHALINAVTVAGVLRQSLEYEGIGGARNRLTELADIVADVAFVAEYCEFLLDWAERRRALLMVQQAAVTLCDSRNDTHTALELLGQQVHQAIVNDRDSAIDDIGGRPAVLATVEQNILMPERQILIATGFTLLDQCIGGLRPSEVTYVGGRPGAGKSAFGGSLGHNIGVEQNVPCVLFSFEMGRQQIWNREVGWLAGIDHSRFDRRETLTDDEQARVRDAIQRLNGSSFYIDARPGCTLQQFRSRVRQLIEILGAQIFIVDQASKFRVDMPYRQRNDELAAVTAAMKSIAMEFNIALVVLHQLNRSSESKVNCRPMMSDLKGSGTFEEDADNILLCYRPEYYGNDSFEDGSCAKGRGDIQVEKLRNGQPGVCRMAFIGKHARWENLELFHTAPLTYQPPHEADWP